MSRDLPDRCAPLPLRLVRRWLPPDRAEDLLGDLAEDFRRRRARHGPIRAGAWAWREAVAWALAHRRPDRGSLRDLSDGWLDDVRFAGRLIGKRPGLSLVVVLTLGFCIGAGSAVFSVVRGAILDPWPYTAPFRIVVLRGVSPTLDRPIAAWSVPEALELSSHPVFEAALMGERWDLTLTEGSGPPQRVRGVRLSASAWPMLGVEPVIGRTFTKEEAGPAGEPVVVLGHALWQGRFGGDPDILGRQVVLESDPYTVIGIMPPRFWLWGAQVWAPLRLQEATLDRTDRWITVQGRIPEGMTVEGAERELREYASRLEREFGAAVPEYGGLRFDLDTLHEAVLGNVQQALLVLSGGVLLVLMVACANIANLLLARTMARQDEFGVRAALGASRFRVLRQLLVESLVLGLLAGGLGILLAHVGLPLLLDLIPSRPIPSETVVEVEGWTVLVALGLSLLAGLALAGPGAWGALRADAAEALVTRRRGPREGRTLGRVRAGLLLAQVVVSMLVVCAAAWLALGYTRLASVEAGFRLQDRLTMRVELSRSDYDRPESIVAFYRDLVQEIERQPGIVSAALVQFLPLTGSPAVRYVSEQAEADPERLPAADVNTVGPGYFEAMGIPVLEGRGFRIEDDSRAGPVAIVSEDFAVRNWPGGDAAGRRLRLDTPAWATPVRRTEPELVESPVEVTIVGVVGDVRQAGLDEPIRPQVYLPHAQSASSRTGLPMRFMSLVVVPELPANVVVSRIRERLSTLDPELPLLEVRPYEDVAVESLGGRRFTAVLLGLFAVLAAALAGIGVFALTSHAVSSRVQEIGIRRALGAGEAELRWLMVRRALLTISAGVLLGAGCALALQRLVSGLVYGFEGTAVLTVGGVALTFLALAALAAYLPARRIARIDPGVALRDA